MKKKKRCFCKGGKGKEVSSSSLFRMSEGGPGWTLKPLTEIKPSSFGRMKQLEREYGHGDYGDLEKKIPNANDPLFKYVKRHLLPKVSRLQPIC